MATEIKSESVQKPEVELHSEVVKCETTEPRVSTTRRLSSRETLCQIIESGLPFKHEMFCQHEPDVSSGEETSQTTEHKRPKVHQRLDWFHPSDDYETEELNSDVSLRESVWYPPVNVVPVLWNGDVYMIDSATMENEQCKLLKYSTARDSWSKFVIPCNIKERHSMDEKQSHALTTYNSKLLLVSGADSESLDPTMLPIRMWEFDAMKSTFKPSPDIILPLSRTIVEQCHVAAASEGKYLIIGGRSRFGDIMQCYLYDGTTWVVCDSPCLTRHRDIQLIIHNGSIFLIERLCESSLSLIYETSLRSIIDNNPDPWQLLKSTMQSSGQQGSVSNFFTLETHLSLVSWDYPKLTVWHYFVNSESWQEAGSASVSFLSQFRESCVCAVRLPDESLMTIFNKEHSTKVCKLKPKLLPRIGPSTKQSTELLKVSQSLPMVKQEKTEKEVGTEKLTHSLSRLSVTSSGASTSVTSRFKSLQQSKSQVHELRSSGESMELAGVDVFGITAIVITNSSLEWQWEGYGLKIHVGENTLPLGIEQCPVNINASLTGHYEFPEDEYLVSAIFWFRCELPCRFAKPISLEIQHCACSHNSLRLSFVKAKCIQEQLPYKFKSIDSGSFSGHSSYGIIEVNSFSAFGVTQKGSGERNYLANVLYIEERLSLDLRFHLYFVVTWNTVIHDRVVKNRFKRAKVYTEQFVGIKDQVEFRVSSSPTRNWIIKSINSHVVKKKDIDEFSPGETSCIPYSQFMAKYSGGRSVAGNVPALECEIDLVGTNEPCTIAIDLSPCQENDPLPSQSVVDEGVQMVHLASDKPDLKELLRELRPKAANWEDIGIELDIDDGDLQSIKSNNPRDSSSCLRDMLRKWLARVFPVPSWTAVVEAVEHLEYEQLAGRLRFKYTL